jgi:hypothetical protein
MTHRRLWTLCPLSCSALCTARSRKILSSAIKAAPKFCMIWKSLAPFWPMLGESAMQGLLGAGNRPPSSGVPFQLNKRGTDTMPAKEVAVCSDSFSGTTGETIIFLRPHGRRRNPPGRNSHMAFRNTAALRPLCARKIG